MKVLHTADWHIGKYLNGYSLLEDQEYFLEKFTGYLKKNKPDVIIIAGDIYDRSVPPAEAVKLFSNALNTIINELKIKVIVIAGNHDSKDRLAFGSEILEKSGLFVISRPERNIKKITLSDEYGNINFYAVPYLDVYDAKSLFPDEKIISDNEAFEIICSDMLKNLNADERNILIAHGFFANTDDLIKNDGTTVGAGELISLKKFGGFDYIALGHIHSPRKTGLDSARYSGSMLKYSVDEANSDKIFYMLDVKEKGKIEITEEKISPLRDIVIIEDSFDNVLSMNPSDDYIFLKLTDKTPVVNAVSMLKAVFPNILGLSYPALKTSSEVSEETVKGIKEKSPLELFDGFFNDITGINLSEFQKKIVSDIFKKRGE